MKLLLLTAFLSAFLFVSALVAQNNCLEFDGDNDRISISGSLNGFTAITIEAWVYAQSFNPQVPDNYISNVAGHDDASALIRIGDDDPSHMQENDRAQLIIITSDGSAKCDAVTNMAANTWYHIAGTYDGSTLRIYVNGILEDSDPLTGIISTGYSEINIGGANAASRLFDGYIDEVRIWNTARTQTEIRQNMYRELSGGETGLFACYKMNETDGTTTATDSEGSLNGTLTNMTGNEWITSPAMSGPKNGLALDGSDDYVACGSGLNVSGTNISIEAWIFPTNFKSASYQNTIIGNDYWGGAASEGYVFRYGAATGDLDFTMSYAGGYNWASSTAPGVLTLDTWQHVAVTYDGSEVVLYVNGAQVLSDPRSTSVVSSTQDARIGDSPGDPGSRLMVGSMDELRVWDITRTPQEIRENMCRILTGNEAGLLAYYTFDNVSGTILQDYSGNSNDGTLTNMDPATDWVTSPAFNTWLNTTDNSWSAATNWSRGSSPGFSDNVGIYAYTGGSDPTVSSAQGVNTLILGSSASLTLGAGLSVGNNLVLETDLDLNGQTIELGPSGMLIEDAGRVFGTSGTIQTTRNFPGTVDEDIAGLGIHLTMDGGTGNTTIVRGHTAQTGGGNESILRYYDITPQWIEFSSADMVFHYNDNELNGLNESNLRLYKSEDNGDTWVVQGGILNTTDNTISLTGLTTFSRWTAGGSGDQSLPVDLSSFTAHAGDQRVTLKWATESEKNNEAFLLERSTDNEHFELLAELDGQGTTSERTEYAFTDISVLNGRTYYYRLGDRDLKGVVTWHNTVEVLPNAAGISIVNTALISDYALLPAYPNPFNPETNIRFAVPNMDKTVKTVQLGIFNLLGQKVATLYDGTLSGGEFTMKWNGSSDQGITQPSGVYLIHFQSEQFVQTQKIILVR